MSRALRLAITTPNAVLLDEAGVRSVRAEDESGGFGVLPGHADLLTVLPPSVLRWRSADGAERYCAIRGGVLTVRGGESVSVACREGLLGRDLRKLDAEVRAARAAEKDAAARARVEATRLHVSAVRRLVRYLRPSGASELLGDEKDAP
ncbi:MAG TPA: F0F1 ATP synthase subunit epsilon [Methylosinus sp.]|uniref:F0F1 ATP synthase subunit epsilon n=1 Tax=Methylosinus sp. TaxID=427 RepID=UPI002F928A12